MHIIFLLSAAIGCVAEFDYCTINCGIDTTFSGPIHILCPNSKDNQAKAKRKENPDPAYEAFASMMMCGGEPGFQPAEKQLIVDTVNKYRSQVAKGSADHQDLPKAANMNKLSWSTELEEIAQAWADSCKLAGEDVCDWTSDNKEVDVLVAAESIGLLPRDKMITGILDEWHGGRLSFLAEDVRTGDKTTLDVPGKFSTLVTAQTRSIGCGILDRHDTTGTNEEVRFVCAFSLKHKRGTPVYIAGDTCRDCASCDDGLCA